MQERHHLTILWDRTTSRIDGRASGCPLPFITEPLTEGTREPVACWSRKSAVDVCGPTGCRDQKGGDECAFETT